MLTAQRSGLEDLDGTLTTRGNENLDGTLKMAKGPEKSKDELKAQNAAVKRSCKQRRTRSGWLS